MFCAPQQYRCEHRKYHLRNVKNAQLKNAKVGTLFIIEDYAEE